MTIHKGFTMIELAMVLVILGILAAVAIPRFIELQANAQQVAVDGVAASLGAASSVNHTACSAARHAVTAGTCMNVTKCSDIAVAITPDLTLGTAGAAIADTYNLAVDTTVTTNGVKATCTLQYSKRGTAYTSTYVVTGAGN